MSKKKIFVIDDSVVGGSPIPTPTQEKTVTLTANNSQQTVTPDSGYLLSGVVAKAQITTEHKVVTTPITANGTYSFTPTDSAHPMDSISIPVNVPSGSGWVEVSGVVIGASDSIDGVSATTIDSTVTDSKAILCVDKQGQDGIYYFRRNPLISTSAGGVPVGTAYQNFQSSYLYSGQHPTSPTVNSGGLAYVTTNHYCFKSLTSAISFKKGANYQVWFMPLPQSASLALRAVTDSVKMDMGKEVGEFAELPVEEVTK